MKNQSMMKKKKQSKKVLSRNSRPRHTNKKSRRASSSQARTTKIDDSNRTRRSSSGSGGYSDNTFRNPTTTNTTKGSPRRTKSRNNSKLRPSTASNPSSLRQRQYIRHFLMTAICLVVVVGIVVLIWALTGKPDVEEIQDTFSNFNLKDFFNSDPFAGKDRNGPQPKWELLPSPDDQNNGKLQLEIWNALDDDWQRIFNVVAQEWNSGSPDTLDLITKRVDVDPNCEPQIGVMKVCNNNYGDTGWLGLNEITIDQTTNSIISSVAKMNEYYLQNAEYDVRQYTMWYVLCVCVCVHFS